MLSAAKHLSELFENREEGSFASLRMTCAGTFLCSMLG